MSAWEWGAAQEHFDRKHQKCGRCGATDHWVSQCKADWCSKCKTMAHTTQTCPKRETTAVCAYCKKKGHVEVHCDKKRNAHALCAKCGSKGHLEEQCPKFKNQSWVKCDRCGDFGHESEQCPSEFCEVCLTAGHKRWCATLWADYQCPRCGKFGHHERRCNAYFAIGSCAKCGKKGHWAVDCLAKSREEFVYITTRKDWTNTLQIRKRKLDRAEIVARRKEKHLDLTGYRKARAKDFKPTNGEMKWRTGRRRAPRHMRGARKIWGKMPRFTGPAIPMHGVKEVMGRLVAVQEHDSYGPAPAT